MHGQKLAMHIDYWNNKYVALSHNSSGLGVFFRTYRNEVRVHYAVDRGREQAAVYE